MTKSFYLVLVVFLIHFSTPTTGQLLPPINEEEFENMFSFSEAEFLNEEALIDGYSQLEENTPEEIGSAISKNVGEIFSVLAMIQAAEIKSRLSEEADLNSEQALLPSDVALSFGQYSDVIGDAIGTLVHDGLVAFKAAQANGEDAGAAVGLVLSNAIRDLNNSAEAIGDAVQQSIDESIAMRGGSVDEDDFGTSGLVIEKLVSSLSAMADDMGQRVTVAVNDAVSQGGDTAHMLGATWRSFITNLESDSNRIGREVADAVVDSYEGLSLSKTEIALIRAQTRTQVVGTLEYLSGSSTQMEKAIIDLINVAVTGANFWQGPAKDTVEVINRLGEFIAQGLKHDAGI